MHVRVHQHGTLPRQGKGLPEHFPALGRADWTHGPADTCAHRCAGYRTDVVEFVSTEHTPRNLLIRAVRMEARPTGSSTSSSSSQSKGSDGDEGEQQGSPGGAVGGTGSGRSRERQGGRAANTAAGAVAAGGGAAGGGAPAGAWDRGALHAAEEYVRLRDYWGVVPHLQVGVGVRVSVGGAGARRLSHGFNTWASHPSTA